MQSKNPVFARSEGFNGQPSAHAGQNYAGGTQGYDQLSAHPDYSDFDRSSAAHGGDRMTIDSVVQKTGLSLAVVMVAAAATWLLTGDVTDLAVVQRLYLLSMVGAFGGFALAMVNSFKRVVSPALVIAYAAVEGVFVGAFSKVIDARFAVEGEGGLILGAVIGTMAAVAGTLAAYKFFNIQVSAKFRKWVMGMVIGFVAVSLLNFVLSFFGADFGFNGFGTMGLISSVIGLGLGVLMLILDFDFVERGIAAGLPERESWRAAFGLTVTIVWIYIELLRILAILRGGD